jgi:hypothetical protein
MFFMEALHKDDGDGDHHKIGCMMMEFTVEPWRWRPLLFQRSYYSQFNMIIYMDVMYTFLFYYSICALHMVNVWS